MGRRTSHQKHLLSVDHSFIAFGKLAKRAVRAITLRHVIRQGKSNVDRNLCATFLEISMFGKTSLQSGRQMSVKECGDRF